MQSLSQGTILLVIFLYFLMLMGIGRWTGKKSDNKNFFTANRQSPWFLVAFGMIGASLSGVTFLSVPGQVGSDGANANFSYMQMVIGYLFGYLLIAQILLPLYYRLQLTTIYEYLDQRFGWAAYKTGSAFFLISRIFGASVRLFLVATVLQIMIMDAWNVPFWLTVIITIALIWIYTFRGGIKTIVLTDAIQTLTMLIAVGVTIYFLCSEMNLGLTDIWPKIKANNFDQWFYFDGGWKDPNNFFKQVLSGALITIVMTGLDQDMMQKNLTCKNIGEAKKNVYTFSIILFFANLLFVTMGALLYIFAIEKGIALPEKADQLFPTIALNHLPAMVGLFFLVGLLAAAYSSADSALTALTTAFCVDFLNFEKRSDKTEIEKQKLRYKVHIGFSVLLALVIIIFNIFDDGSVLTALFIATGYTYGPILALFCFGLMTSRQLKPYPTIIICILSPIICYIINVNSAALFSGFTFGFLILLLNAILAFFGLYCFSYVEHEKNNRI